MVDVVLSPCNSDTPPLRQVSPRRATRFRIAGSECAAHIQMPPRRRAPAASSEPEGTGGGGTGPQRGLLSVILPTYNEAENLPIVLWLLARELTKKRVWLRRGRHNAQRCVLACAPPGLNTFPPVQRSAIRYEVVVVDDASPDGTQDVVHALAGVYGSDVVRLAARPGKLGLGAFVRQCVCVTPLPQRTGAAQAPAATCVGACGPDTWSGLSVCVCVATGSAYLHGLKFARGDRVVIMDADLSHHVRGRMHCVARAPAGTA